MSCSLKVARFGEKVFIEEVACSERKNEVKFSQEFKISPSQVDNVSASQSVKEEGKEAVCLKRSAD